MIIDIKEFETLLHSINRCYAKGVEDKLPTVSDFSTALQGPNIDTKTCEEFSIHTHTFLTESWIVCGKIINYRFKVEKSDAPTNHSLFIIGYNESLNEVNQHTSSANNTNTFVSINQTSEEIYIKG